MRNEAPRVDSSTAARGCSQWWVGSLCLPGQRMGLARLVCLFGLFALLVSAISPVDDAVQPDFSRNSSNWHRNVTASKLVGPSHMIGGHCAAAPIAFGAYAGPTPDAGYPTPVLYACSSSPGCESAHTERAPPLFLSLPRST